MKKIAILFWCTIDLEGYPSVINAAEAWVKQGYIVEIIINKKMETKYSKPGITIKYFGNEPYGYLYKALTYLKKKQHDLYIAYDHFGLFLAIKSKNKAPIIYHSLEILDYRFDYNKPSRFRSCIRLLRLGFSRWKLFEKRCRERILFAIVQDENRERFLRKQYGFIDKVVHVPNSKSGFFDRKTDYLRKKCQLGDSQKIILYSGALEEWALTEEIVKAAITWPDDWVFLMHGYSQGGAFLKKIKPLVEKHAKKIYLVLEFLDNDEYDEMVGSADIGLAWYRKELPETTFHIGAASGKLFQYLHCGLPVVVPKYIPDMTKIVDSGRIGSCASNEWRIADSIKEILLNYTVYEQNVSDFYLKNYEFENNYLKVIKQYEK